MFEKREIYRAIAEAAYAIARAGDGLQIEERDQFYAIINKNLDFDSWSAESRFELLEELHPDPQNAFNYAMSELKKYKAHLTPALKQLTIEVAEAVARAYHGKNIKENNLIQRLKETIETQ